MAQLDGQGVSDGGLIQFGDGVLRALVVVILLFGYLDWLGRSPLPALAVGIVVALLLRAWRRAPWVQGDHREPRMTSRHRAAQLDEIDLMTSREFQALIAALMRRDRFVEVRPTGMRDDLSTDVLGRTPAGHRVVVQCSRDDARRRVGSAAVQKFLGSVDTTDVAVLVTTGRFSRSALAFGERGGVVLLDRSHVAAWMAGRATQLTPYFAR